MFEKHTNTMCKLQGKEMLQEKLGAETKVLNFEDFSVLIIPIPFICYPNFC